jgi:SAM-dependent methyltransferase
MQAPQLQQSSATAVGRYWTEHSVLRRYFPSDRDLRILSFGCSTGEELLTLRMLFPSADLYGCETDWYNLQRARALVKGSAVIFDSSPAEIESHGPFDIILCNSVLLRSTGRKPGIDSRLWLDVVEGLDRSLKPGGVVQIINTNIPFRFYPKASNFEPLRSPLILSTNFVDLFDLDGNHLCSGVPRGGFGVLRCHLGEEGWSKLLPSDLDDVHFRKKGGKALPAIADELSPNFRPAVVAASGQATYRTTVPDDLRPATKVDLDVSWTAYRNAGVRLSRIATRTWFDGSETKRIAELDLIDDLATTFVETVSGRRSKRLSLAMLEAQRLYSPVA